ncbi:TIGR04551 family protein [Myxococcaceae bacterium GXIMD 01537]
MSHPLLAALLVASATATAQTQAPAGQTPPPAQAAPAQAAPAQTPPSAAPTAPAEAPSLSNAAEEAIQREVDKRLETAKEELREEIRAQMATQAASSEWQQEWQQEKRKLELFTLDGYMRLRPNLLYKFDLGKPPGTELFPRSPRSNNDNTQAGADMRLRLEPTLNISEEVRVKVQLDALDNVLFGSTPSDTLGGSNRDEFVIFSESQNPPNSAINALKDSVQVKRAYGEVSTPVGILRFGRMGAHWGLGVVRHDGECLDCDFGDNADRIQFVTEPFAGWYVTPMLEFGSEGPYRPSSLEGSEPVDLTQADDTTSWMLSIARRDTEQQRKSKLDNNQGVLNYGLQFTYRTQGWAPTGYYSGNFSNGGVPPVETGFVPRDGTLYIPDLWLRYEERLFRLEVEFAAYLGTIGNRAETPADAGNTAFNQSLSVRQFGGVAQGEYKLLDGKLSLGLELGFASGDKAPGFGYFQNRTKKVGDATVLAEPQYACGAGGCSDNSLRNFRFNRAYRIDLILWREILGGITDAFYVKPGAKYSVTEGLELFGSVIYSQAFYSESTPSTVNSGLGVEIDVGAQYETEDGFVAGVAWGILFPLAGLQEAPGAALRPEFETAQALRGTLGIRF